MQARQLENLFSAPLSEELPSRRIFFLLFNATYLSSSISIYLPHQSHCIDLCGLAQCRIYKMNSTLTSCRLINCCRSFSLRTAALPRAAGNSRTFSQVISQSPRRSWLRQTPREISPLCAYIRHNSSSSSDTPKPLTDVQSDQTSDAEREEQNRKRREQEPAYQITFTCKPCGHRSSHRISKHGYHDGTVLIRCPSCKNRHVISDHLNIFFDKKSTLEDILRDQGKALTKGYLDGDVEFWDDGTVRKQN